MPAYRCVLAVYLRPVDKLIEQTVNTHTIQAYANLELYTQISGTGRRGSHFMLLIPKRGKLAEKL